MTYAVLCKFAFPIIIKTKCFIVCGGEFTDETGVIQSPYFPNSYPHDRVCIYVIRQPVGKAIVLNFTSFDVEDPIGERCYFDYLEVGTVML